MEPKFICKPLAFGLFTKFEFEFEFMKLGLISSMVFINHEITTV